MWSVERETATKVAKQIRESAGPKPSHPHGGPLSGRFENDLRYHAAPV